MEIYSTQKAFQQFSIWGIILFCGVSLAFGAGGHNEERQLYHVLFDNYLSKVRPVRDSSHIVHVDVKFELSHITHLDEINQVLYTVGFLVATWEDEYLKWDPKDFAGIDHLIVPPSSVWLPDFAMLNSATAFYESSFTTDFRVNVLSNGTIVWAFGGNFANKCPLDLTYYPFDRQTCSVIIENWSYSGHQVNLEIGHHEVVLDDYHQNGEWTLDHSKVKKTNIYHDTFPDVPYPKVTFELYLTRKTAYYMMNILAPCFMMIGLSLSVFWLPAASGEKIGLSITVLLAYSVFMFVIADNTPKNSDFTPVLTVFVAGIMGMSALSVVTSVWVLYLHEHAGPNRVPYCLRVLCFKYLARAYCMKSSVPEMDKVGPSPEDEGKADKTDIENISSQNLKEKLQSSSLPDNSIEDILSHLTFLTDRLKGQDADEEIKEEWQAVARILDRTLFFLCTFTIFVFTIYMIVQEDDAH